ncbi:MAG: ribosome small subunit-dependent GTPase A [Eubacterium sp.]|nr:ribosome small subunit-dependent GTPase A [Eubacterium sp.]
MRGKIIKGIAGFYYVSTVESGTYACKARGIFRKDGKKPLVGDDVEIVVTHEKDREANVIRIEPRKNELIRPAVANVDQAAVLFALRNPNPDQLMIDRFLVMMERQNVPAFIILNKSDLVTQEEIGHWQEIYRASGYDVLICSAEKEHGMDEILERLRGKVTVVAGPSGVGKSTITNLMQQDIVMETGSISRKLGRGRHTTRHSELIPLDHASYICDTPGFTSLQLPDFPKETLEQYFPEIREHASGCRFVGCAHIHEPDCSVKQAVEDSQISSERYQSFVRLYRELEEQEKRRY